MSLKTYFNRSDVLELEELRAAARDATSVAAVAGCFDCLWPEPDRALELPDAPRIPGTLLEAFAGQSAPWTFLCASILARELAAHADRDASWHRRQLLVHNPWPHLQSDARIFAEPVPNEWRPLVREESHRTLVSFLTLSGGPAASIVHHEDRFGREGYDFSTAQRVVARLV